MPFGLTNALATFQCAMNSTFQPYLRKFVLVFFYDIQVYRKTWADHLTHLRAILGILAKMLFVNLKKCSLWKTEVEYLGHMILYKEVSMDCKKVEAILKWPISKTVKALRGLLGLAGQYRRFINGYGKIARPLTNLQKKGNFKWSPESAEVFAQLQQAITKAAPVLTMPDFSQPFSIECDASRRGIGAVLSQNKKAIAFLSKPLYESSLRKSVYEKELMGLVLAIQQWRLYLIGRKFTVYTDQRKFMVYTDKRSLKYLLEHRITTQSQQNQLAKLLGYEFDIVYKMAAANKVANALSRMDEEKELQGLSKPN